MARPESEQRNIVDGWAESGLTQRAYCEQVGIPLSTFTLWRRRAAEDSSPLRLVEVKTPVPASAYEVVLRGGRVLRVPERFDPATLSSLVAALES